MAKGCLRKLMEKRWYIHTNLFVDGKAVVDASRQYKHVTCLHANAYLQVVGGWGGGGKWSK
jgi:hypothetical protein